VAPATAPGLLREELRLHSCATAGRAWHQLLPAFSTATCLLCRGGGHINKNGVWALAKRRRGAAAISISGMKYQAKRGESTSSDAVNNERMKGERPNGRKGLQAPGFLPSFLQTSCPHTLSVSLLTLLLYYLSLSLPLLSSPSATLLFIPSHGTSWSLLSPLIPVTIQAGGGGGEMSIQ